MVQEYTRLAYSVIRVTMDSLGYKILFYPVLDVTSRIFECFLKIPLIYGDARNIYCDVNVGHRTCFDIVLTVPEKGNIFAKLLISLRTCNSLDSKRLLVFTPARPNRSKVVYKIYTPLLGI